MTIHRPSGLPRVGVAVPSTAASPGGFVLTRKLPGEPWQFVNVLLDGGNPKLSEAALRVQQALVGGYIEGVGYPTPAHPYRFVCNEDGRARGLEQSATVHGPFADSVLFGPVLFVRCRRKGSEWTTASMSLAQGASVHLEALRKALGLRHAPTGEDVVEQPSDLHLTSVATEA